MGNTFCPIISAGWLANEYSERDDRKDCGKENCEMWDEERETCGLKQGGEKKES